MTTRKIGDVIDGQTILTAPQTLDVRTATQFMVEHRVGSIMVVDDEGQLLGIFTERDALARVLAAGRQPESTVLGDVMTPAPMCVSPEHSLAHALHLMYDNGFRHVPVTVDGQPVGMVSARDALGPEMLAFEAEIEQRETITALL